MTKDVMSRYYLTKKTRSEEELFSGNWELKTKIIPMESW